MFVDLTLYEFLLILIALIISAPVLIVLGYLLCIVLFYVFLIAVTLAGGVLVIALAAGVILWEAVESVWLTLKRWCTRKGNA